MGLDVASLRAGFIAKYPARDWKGVRAVLQYLREGSLTDCEKGKAHWLAALKSSPATSTLLRRLFAPAPPFRSCAGFTLLRRLT
jgi:hypothetical protein